MNSELVAQIVALFHGGATERAPRSASARASKLDAYESAIADLRARDPDISVRRIHEELRQLGFTGGYTVLSERVLRLRPTPVVAPVRRFETAPGEQAQMDCSTYDLDFTDEGRRRVYAFSYVLGYSRRQYLHFVEAQDFATTIREHIHAFEHLGGVAATYLYDNMKVVVSGYDGDDPVYNPRFLAFAAHYGFRPAACRPRRPRVSRPGTSERDHGVVAGRSRRYSHSQPNQGPAARSPRRGICSFDRAAGAAVRHCRGRLPHRRRRGLRGLPPELLLGSLATDRPSRRRAHLGKGSDHS